uniref:Transposase (Putative), gypsy type n=1 Tax=Tanacetum cinerariifolium TaxID=118510 RepID=A0A6L2M1F5_TANCI|nr:hypothetical protein [Tanacetum cinerariifolium]GEV40527.1 hypothetical protein [Tanacetum cinerariifolium]
MPLYKSEMTAKDVKSLAIQHGIPLDLHPVALTKGWTMDQLPDDMIGLNRLTMFELYCRSLGIVASGAGGQVFCETFSGLKGLKKRFFFLDRRAIPDAMSWRHHDSDAGLATTWDFPGFRPTFKDTKGNGVTMSEYLCFPFLSGASISKGPALTSQDRIEQNTTRPLPPDRAISEKTDHQKRVEVEDPKIVATRERKARAAAKKRERQRQASEATSSPQPLRAINPANPSGDIVGTAESREDRSPCVSPHGSANHSLHNYSNSHVNKGTRTLQLGTSEDPSERAMTTDTEVLQPSPTHQSAHHSHVEGGKSSRRGSLYVPDWSIHHRCHLDTPLWCRELMVHLAPLVAQEESNAMNNAIALERAWFSLVRGDLAQTDILERFEHLESEFNKLVETHAECGETVRKLVQARLDLAHSSHLYTTLSERHKAVKSKHESCAGRLETLRSQNDELSQANRDQAIRIRELVTEERFEEDLLELMGRMEGFDVHADTKMKVEYDKLFERQYPYLEKISRGFRHSVSDLLKVYPDSPPSGQAPSTSAPNQP